MNAYRPSRARLAVRALAVLCVAAAPAARPAPSQRPAYWASATCKGCHARIYDQHLASHHERSFTNPVFQAQYFEEVLPRASRDPALAEEARRCTACHAPVVYAASHQALSSANLLDPSMSGVTCDLCHTIQGWEGAEPGNGNFLSSPSTQKRGPLPGDATWHRQYSAIHTRSELCATCHEATNHRGVVVKGTYSEWKASPFARAGVHCQDCHMTRDGFLVGGQPRFESGKAAEGAALIAPPVRDRLSTHRFSGAHSRSQVEGAIGLALKASPATALPGETVELQLTVDSTRSGHKFPTGSADLRLLWLEVTARSGEQVVRLPARYRARGTYAVAGQGPEDARILGTDVPEGSRIYRAVYFDAQGHHTLSSWDAAAIVHDNRLEAGERRVEVYSFTVPKGAAGAVRLDARLRYRSYPTAFATWTSLPAAEPVDVASASAELRIGAPSARRPQAEERRAPAAGALVGGAEPLDVVPAREERPNAAP